MEIWFGLVIVGIFVSAGFHIFNSNQDHKTKMNLIRRVQRIEKELGITND